MKKLFFVLLVVPFFLSSCQKENFDTEPFLEDLDLKFETDDPASKACFEVNFPLTIILPNGTEVEGDSREDLAKAIKRYYRQNDRKKGDKITFKYPISVQFDGETIRIADARQFERIKMACWGDKDDDGKEKVSCMELVYPITYIMPDRTSLTVEDKKSEAKAMKEWFEEHPDYQRQRPKLQYPVDVLFKGRPMTIEEEAGMGRLRKACKGEVNKDQKLCFELVYPLTYTMPDRSNLEVASKVEADRLFSRWYEANPRLRNQKPELQFPIEIKYAPSDRGGEEKIVEIIDQEAFDKAVADCKK
ncbi:MAG: hypothetical protein U9N86_15295 [Bacteroidota bacterium]|nr:hypothetical protein [Bacteroidota bacterium]